MAAREFLRITKEVTFGTYQASPPTSDVCVIQLTAPNAFTMRPVPRFANTRSAGASNRPVTTQSAQVEVKGKLNTLLYPSQAKVMLPWAITLSGTVLDLGSVTIDHAFRLDDGSALTYRRYLGCKVDALALSASNSGDAIRMATSYDITAQKPATITVSDLPEPAYGTAPTYPGDNPYLFEQSKSLISIGGVTRANYRSFGLNVKNILRGPFDENQYISSLHWSGRDVSFDLDARILAATDRAALEAVTQQALSVGLTDGTNTCTLNAQGNCYIKSVSDDLAWGDPGFYQKLMMEAYLDTTAGTPTDLTVTNAP